MNVANAMEAAAITHLKSLIDKHERVLTELEKKKAQNKAAYERWKNRMTPEEFKQQKAIFNKQYYERRKAKKAAAAAADAVASEA